jgi:hypothetical protein
VKLIAGSLVAASILLTQGCGGSHRGENQPRDAGDSSIVGSGGASGSGGSGGPSGAGGRGGAGGSGGSGGIAPDAGGDHPSDTDARTDSGTDGGSGRCRKTNFKTGFGLLPVSVLDFSGDGVLDLLAPEGVYFDPAHLVVAIGDGAGSFQQPQTLDVQVDTEFFAAGDFDADGNVDVVGLSLYGPLQLFRGTGNGQLAAANMIANLGQSGESVAVADFNEDGKPDIVVGASEPGRLEVFLGQGNGSFRTSQVSAIGQLLAPVKLLLGDYNEDGHKDLLVFVGAQAGGQAIVFLGRGDGGFSMQRIFSLVNITGLATADFNNDGHVDLVAAYGDSHLTVQLGAGDGTFSGVTGLSPNTKANSDDVISADVSGDGIPDVIAGNPLPYTISILVGRGDGTFADGIVIPVDTDPYWMRAGDLNRDGVADLVTVNPTDGADIYLGPCP